jgi:hypothetical protein
MRKGRKAKTRMMICLECGEPREVESDSFGVIVYRPCPNCKAIGICPDWSKDGQAVIRKKKGKRDLYERSRYRGGKLR